MTIATALSGYLSTALATMTAPTAAEVRAGEPDVVNLPLVAYWYTGTKTWEANTLSVTQELSCWHVRIYVPVSARFTPIDGGVEGWIETLVGAIRAQLFGNVAMGGAATGGGLDIGDATSGWAQVGQQLCRVVDMDLEVMLAAVHTISH